MSKIFFDLILSHAKVLLPSPSQPEAPWKEQLVSIGIVNGKIAQIWSATSYENSNRKAQEVINLDGLHLLPGVIDSQVHFREPGYPEKENIESGTRSAILGGVTTIFEMPNTRPPTTNLQRLLEKLAIAQNTAWCDYAFFIGASSQDIHHHGAEYLSELEKQPGCCGIKVFMGSSTGNLLIDDASLLEKVFNDGGIRRVAIHAEDEARLSERRALFEGPTDPHSGEPISARLHPIWRDEESAFRATRTAVSLALKTKRRIHLLHMTTQEEVEWIAQHPELKSLHHSSHHTPLYDLPVTLEVLPQHLTFTAPECYDQWGSLVQMNPPIRSERHREALWKALHKGLIHVIGSDHAPHTIEEKRRPWPQSPSGFPGVQTLLPVMLNHVNEGRLTLQKLIELTAKNPAELYKIPNKGSIAEGMDADLVAVDLKKCRALEASEVASRCGWSPFVDMKLTGWPIMTFLRGRAVMRDGEVMGSPQGQPVSFQPTLPMKNI